MRKLALLLLVATGAVAEAQTGRDQPAAITGQITAADTGLALPDATVRLVGSGGSHTAAADENGFFQFTTVAPGDYVLSAVHAGYAIAAYGQLKYSDLPRSFGLRSGQTMAAADIQLTPLGIVSGRLVDENGKPVAKARVQALPIRQPWSLRSEVRFGQAAAVTDAGGEFRITGLGRGRYNILAGRSGPSPFSGSGGTVIASYADGPTYYPGTAVPAEAIPVSAEPGAETTNITFALQRVPLARIAGQIVHSAGQRPEGYVATMMALDPAIPMLASYAEVDSEGRFTLADMPPGEYRLEVRHRSFFEAIASRGGSIGQPQAVDAPEFASTMLRVTGADVADLTVPTTQGFNMTGALSVQGDLPPQALAKIRIHASGLSTSSTTLVVGGTSVQPDRSFVLRNLIGTQLFRVGELPAGWMLRRVTLAGLDVTDAGVELTHDMSGIELVIGPSSGVDGRVEDRRGVAIPGASVIVFAEERRLWNAPQRRYVRSAIAGPDGTFSIADLPAGRYVAAAQPTLIEGMVNEPDALDALESAGTRLRVTDGQRATVTLRLE